VITVAVVGTVVVVEEDKLNVRISECAHLLVHLKFH
jgi:hypothetical protein